VFAPNFEVDPVSNYKISELDEYSKSSQPIIEQTATDGIRSVAPASSEVELRPRMEILKSEVLETSKQETINASLSDNVTELMMTMNRMNDDLRSVSIQSPIKIARNSVQKRNITTTPAIDKKIKIVMVQT
jgi:uncharacterized coiled-coil protein SlyX